MPLKTSKGKGIRPQLLRDEPDCSEKKVLALASEVALGLSPNELLILEGSMGAGKTTFAKKVLETLGVTQPPEGSPTFSLAHEYDSPKGQVIHIDFYRLKSEQEIEDAGIQAYYWEREAIVISEWLSSWPEFEVAVFETHRKKTRVQIHFYTQDATLRHVRIEKWSK